MKSSLSRRSLGIKKSLGYGDKPISVRMLPQFGSIYYTHTQNRAIVICRPCLDTLQRAILREHPSARTCMYNTYRTGSRYSSFPISRAVVLGLTCIKYLLFSHWLTHRSSGSISCCKPINPSSCRPTLCAKAAADPA